MWRFVMFGIFLLINSSVFSQVLDISVRRPAIKAVDSIERVNKGKIAVRSGAIFRISSGYFPNSDNYQLGQPIALIRETIPVKTILNYYYSLPDSVIRLIEYTWNAGAEEREKLSNIFEINSRHFSKHFGNNGNTMQEDHETWSQKTTIWKNEETYVEQFMVIGSGTYRVRVLVSWK